MTALLAWFYMALPFALVTAGVYGLAGPWWAMVALGAAIYGDDMRPDAPPRRQ